MSPGATAVCAPVVGRSRAVRPAPGPSSVTGLLVAGVLAVSLLVVSLLAAPKAGAGGGVTDVGPGHQVHPQITWAAGQGIVQGYPDGTFRPLANVTRQAMAAFLHRFAGSPAVVTGAPSFRDVSPAHPFFVEIEWLADEGIAQGYADGTFRSGAAVSRQAMAAYLYRVAGSPKPPPLLDLSEVFDDVSRNHPFFVPITFLYDFSLAEGFNDGGFHPGAAVSRQATAAFLFRLNDLFDEGVVGPASADDWPEPAERAAALPPWVHRG